MWLDAVKAELRDTRAKHDTPLVPEECPTMIEALEGHYKYKRRSENASTEYEDKPEKAHPWADLADSPQYRVLGMRGRAGSMRGTAGERERQRDKERRSRDGGKSN